MGGVGNGGREAGRAGVVGVKGRKLYLNNNKKIKINIIYSKKKKKD